MLALYDFFWSMGTENQGLLVSSAGGPQIQLLGDTEVGVVISHADGTGHFFPGYFCGVSSNPNVKLAAEVFPFDSQQGPALSLIPFNPLNPSTPRALSFPLRHGDTYQNTGSLPSVGVYTSSTISDAVPSGASITIP